MQQCNTLNSKYWTESAAFTVVTVTHNIIIAIENSNGHLDTYATSKTCFDSMVNGSRFKKIFAWLFRMVKLCSINFFALSTFPYTEWMKRWIKIGSEIGQLVFCNWLNIKLKNSKFATDQGSLRTNWSLKKNNTEIFRFICIFIQKIAILFGIWILG